MIYCYYFIFFEFGVFDYYRDALFYDLHNANIIILTINKFICQSGAHESYQCEDNIPFPTKGSSRENTILKVIDKSEVTSAEKKKY